jgi:hypothetical protein
LRRKKLVFFHSIVFGCLGCLEVALNVITEMAAEAIRLAAEAIRLAAEAIRLAREAKQLAVEAICLAAEIIRLAAEAILVLLQIIIPLQPNVLFCVFGWVVAIMKIV